MPDGSNSICVRLHRCAHFQNLLRKYGRQPPPNVIDDINKHKCPQGVCCPDYAVKLTTTPKTSVSTTTEEMPRYGELKLNFGQIRNHPNYHLINKNTCGIKVAQRIIGVTVIIQSNQPAKITNFSIFQHCIKNNLHVARLGEHTISTSPDCDSHGSCVYTQDILIEEVIKHPRYSKRTDEHDIALLKLASSANTLVHNVKTICLPTYEKADIERIKHKNFTISGWGKTGNGRKSDVLLKSEVRFQDANQCNSSLSRAAHRVVVYDENICAGGYDKLHGCKGDSGGGLTTSAVIDRKERTFLYGLLARGVLCDTHGVFPDVYMNIKNYLRWILDSMS
ncbi:serine protease grass-like [Chironomus tepperi]|uniref:serine protease grass-like n=1 Tax=Chironomus tepperi TaxID=113505 RepID=UPI00391EFA63